MERRRSIRKPFRAPVDYPSPHWPYQHFIDNISAEGMQIHTLDRIDPGVELKLSFDLPEHHHMDIRGKVVHAGKDGLGVRFLFPGKGLKAKLAALIDRMGKKS
jgi:hypothetical protein